MMRRVLVVIAICLASLSTGMAPAGAVSGGSPVPAGSWEFVAKVDVGGRRLCSGALVGPQWVVTATSCFAVAGAAVSTGAPAQATTATIGRATLPVVWIVPHPSRDVLLAKLSLRVTDVVPISVSGAAPALGDALQATGVGRTATAWLTNRPEAAGGDVSSVAADTFGWTAPDVSLCKGDAGGPVFRTGGSQLDLVGLAIAANQGGCLGEADAPGDSRAVRVDDLKSWIAQNTPGLTTAFQSFHRSAAGIGGYDLVDVRDQVVAFDYEHSGRLDHLLLYRPGAGLISIVKHGSDGTYTSVFRSTAGIGGLDLRNAADRVVAYDYDHSGNLDHLVVYRPGSKTAVVVKHGAGATFTAVYSSTTGGIGGYNLLSAADRVVAYDFEHSGKLDHLLLYRPGTGIVWIVKHGSGNTFTAVYQSSTGIGGYDLRVAADRIVAFDYDHSGKPDHLVLYRPGNRTVFVLRHDPGTAFAVVYSSTTAGIGGYNLADVRDQVIAFDYERSGRLDHLLLYRPGVGTAWILAHGAGNAFSAVYHGDLGIGGYDLKVTADQIVAFDQDHSGGPNHLALYRPGNRLAWIVGRTPVTPPATAPVTVQPPADGPESIVEDYGYPGAAAILASLHVRLITGDGHILLADCATPPVDNVGAVKVWTTEPVGANGAGLICFTVAGPVGRLDLEVPGVYELRGDGQQPGFGHPLTAVVTTASGPPTSVVINPSGSTQVGIGANPDNEPTTLLQLRVPS